jgi:hypothetical protein
VAGELALRARVPRSEIPIADQNSAFAENLVDFDHCNVKSPN